MRTLFQMLGFADLGTTQMLVIAVIAWACAFALAWIADAILGDGVFGVLLNTSILIVGAVLGTMLWRKVGFGPAANLPETLSIVATSSGIALLLACATVRRWI
jgi:uncharacterized membrane protein YeaQ/YmgE (transglycosylase-associated protein family)